VVIKFGNVPLKVMIAVCWKVWEAAWYDVDKN